MVTHTLDLAPITYDQDVLCVTTVLPSYLFVFHLNRILGLSLTRSREDLLGNTATKTFAVYEYTCDVMQQSWRVVENKHIATETTVGGGLFNETEKQTLLFAQLTQADLLVCVHELTEEMIQKIKSIGRVISCYQLPKQLNYIKEKLTF